MIVLLCGTEHRCCLTCCLEDIFFVYIALYLSGRGFGRRIKTWTLAKS